MTKLIVSLLILLISTVALRATVGFTYSAFIPSILYIIFIGYHVQNWRHKKWKLLLLFLIPIFLISILPRIIEHKNTGVSFMEMVIHLFVITSAFYIFSNQKRLKWVSIILLIFATIWASWTGQSYWHHYNTFNTFTGNIKPYPANDFNFYNDQFDTLSFKSTYKDKYVVLDLWHTACAACFQAFPKLQSLYEKEKNNPNLTILSVNFPLKTDSIGKSFQLIKELGYTFPVINILDGDGFLNNYNVSVFPTVIIINPQQEVIFFGNLTKAINYIDKKL